MHKENQTKAEIKKHTYKEGCDYNNCRLDRSSNGTASSSEWKKNCPSGILYPVKTPFKN